ncbi:MAG: SUMF1/EgtB/PvdO family nonheme iron enzyme [Patescibacteria group bacterium]
MKRFVIGGARFIFVGVGIIALTSFTIDATDLLRGSQSALGILADRASRQSCPEGMVFVDDGAASFCIDQYEVSPDRSCPTSLPRSAAATTENLNSGSCEPVSEPDVQPWTNVAKHQAEALCRKAGKRLPTLREWYVASQATPDTGGACNIAGTKTETGTWSACVSGVEAFDMVGNVWEWVDAEVVEGSVAQRELPEEGYVTSVSGNGLADTTSASPSELFGDDYFWSPDDSGRYVVMRGGFYGSREDAGVFTTHAHIDPSFAGEAIGFRCAISQ